MFKKMKRSAVETPSIPNSNQTPGSIPLLEHMSCKNGRYGEKDIQKLANKLVSKRQERETLCYLIAYVLEANSQHYQTLIDVMDFAKRSDFQEITLCMKDLAQDAPKSPAVKFFYKSSHTEKVYKKTSAAIVEKLEEFILWNKR